jgi:hypothetical protein
VYKLQIINVLNGLFLWTNTILMLSCFIEPLDFTGNIVIVILGAPFIGLIVQGRRDERKAYLMMPNNKF